MGRYHFYSDVIARGREDPEKSNSVWRAKNGYKEMEVHDPPPRRNNDFKAVHSWSAKGMPNYKHAEPFYLLKNMTQVWREESNPAIRWTKRVLYAGTFGAIAGFAFFVGSPKQSFVMNQLFYECGPREFAGRTLKLFKIVMPKYFFMAGSVALLYSMARDY